MPHELLGIPKDSINGILLSMEIMSSIESKSASLAGTNKAKQQSRYSKFYANNPQYRR